MRCAQPLWGVVCDSYERRGVLFVNDVVDDGKLIDDDENSMMR